MSQADLAGLLHVVPLASELGRTPGGHRVILISFERWEDHSEIRYALVGSRSRAELREDMRTRRLLQWEARDDAGHEYAMSGGGGGNRGLDILTAEAVLKPGLPSDVDRLTVTASIDGEPIGSFEVEL